MIWGVPGLLLVAAGAAAVLVRRRFVVVRVRGTSMFPTYRPGDRVLVRRAASLRRGEVVVLESRRSGRWRTGPLPGPASGDWLIKRVAALPGDTVPVDCDDVRAGEIVPPGMIIVLGDGERSADSRHWGPVPMDRVLGRVVRQLAGAAS